MPQDTENTIKNFVPGGEIRLAADLEGTMVDGNETVEETGERIFQDMLAVYRHCRFRGDDVSRRMFEPERDVVPRCMAVRALPSMPVASCGPMETKWLGLARNGRAVG